MPAFSSQEEVSTSSNAREQSVSSLGTAFQPSMLGNVRKVEMESTTGECDTTQEDLPHEAGWCRVKVSSLSTFCLTSAEARWLIRDGGGGAKRMKE